jgi:AraC-like DNA-binding protein
MSIRFRAADVPVAAREEYWRHVLSEQLGLREVRLQDGPGPQNELVVTELGAVRLIESGTGPGRARHTASHIAGVHGDLFQLLVEIDGVIVGRQGGHVAELSPGDLSLVDLSRPLSCDFPAHRAVLLTFPGSLLPLPRRQVDPVIGARIPGDSGTPALVSNLVRQLPRLRDDDIAGTRLGATVLDLLTVALATRLERTAAVPGETRQRALLARIHAFIEAHLTDPDLTPDTVAAAHHISLRYLHRLFQTQGHTVAGLIRQRRLQRCRADLLDPALAERPVSATAARWGFANPAHFNRLFRDTYGVPPGEFRRVHTTAAA